MFLPIFFFIIAALSQSIDVTFFEMSRVEVSAEILHSSLIFNDTIFVISTQDSHLLIYNITNIEQRPILITEQITAVTYTDFSISNENYIIGLGNEIIGAAQILEIFLMNNMSDLSNLSHVITYNMSENTNEVRSLICLNKQCDAISFIDIKSGIKLIDLTLKDSPQEIPQTEILTRYTSYIVLITENQIIATYNSTYVVKLDISNLNDVQELDSLKTSSISPMLTIAAYNSIIIYVKGNMFSGSGALAAWAPNDYNPTESVNFDPIAFSNGKFTVPSARNGRISIRVYNDFLIIGNPSYQMIALPSLVSYNFITTASSDAYLLHKNGNYYNIFLYNQAQYYKITYLFNISSAANTVSYTIANVTTFTVESSNIGPLAVLIVNDDENNYLVTLPGTRPVYYEMPSYTTLQSPLQINNVIIFANNLWRDTKKRYFMIAGPDYFSSWTPEYVIWIYNYNLQPNSSVATISIATIMSSVLGNNVFVVYPVQFDDLIYLLPITWNYNSPYRNYLIVFNISDLTNLNIEDTNVGSAMGTSQFRNAFGGCEKDGQRFLFVKRESESFIYLYNISNDNYTQLEIGGKIFVSSHFAFIVTTDDCNYLYAGGDSFIAVDISNFSQPQILASLNINTVTSLKIIGNRIYLVTPQILYIFDNSKHFPVLISSIANFNNQNYIYNIDILQGSSSNYLYKGSSKSDPDGGYSITIYEERKRFYIYFKLDQNLIVGEPIIYSYHCVDLINLIEIKGAINSVQLTNATANFPTLTSLPSWILFDFNAQKTTITVAKNYQYDNLSLVFEMKYPLPDTPEIYSQIITFPYAVSSLSYKMDPSVIISTPSTNNIQIKINHYPNIKFIFLSFAGVFITYSQETGELIATGFLNAINVMFSRLRITKINTSGFYLQTFNLTIQDSLNNDINEEIITYNESVLKFNKPPNCSIENFQQVIDNQTAYAYYTVPFERFSYDLQPNLFSDPDLDSLSFQIFSTNNLTLPEWLNFDSFSFRIYGTPSASDIGLLNLSLQISDGNDYIIKNFYVNINDIAPEILNPLQNQIKNNTVSVGNEFTFDVNAKTFQDLDGPYSLEYTVFYADKNNEQKQLVPTSNYWLKYDNSIFSFYGIPNVNDADEYGNNVTITIVANDGVKTSNDSFVIVVFPSLKITDNINTDSIPAINYPDNKNLNLDISVQNASIIILNSFLSNYSSQLAYKTNENKSNILLTGTVDLLNKAFNYLVYRNISHNNGRRILEENQKFISYAFYDDIGQNISGQFKANLVTISNAIPQINRNLMQSYYLAEIDASFQILISKKILTYTDIPNMKLNYSFVLLNSYGVSQTWMYMQENGENLEIFTGGKVSSDLKDIYKAELVILDEFLYEYKYEFVIEVDYSVLDKFLNYLKLISAIVGPIISALAFVRFFYLIYNWIWEKEIVKKDIFLKVNTPFKIKIPLIEEEYKLASSLFSEIKKTALKENKKYFELFLKYDIMGQSTPLANQNQFDDYVKQYFKGEGQKSNNVIVMTEGLLIRHLVNKFPKALVFLKQFEIEAIKSNSSDVDEWYNQFFFHQSIAEEENLKEILANDSIIEKLKISDYVLQTGSFKSLEKNLYVLGHYYNVIFEKTVSRLKKDKIILEHLLVLKPLILRAVIEIKRGLPFKYSHLALRINSLFQIVRMRILPITYGDSIHLTDGSIKYIKTFEEKKENEDLKVKKGCTSKIRKIFERCFPYKPYMAINEKTFPDWFFINLKKGYLIFHGTPYSDEVKKKYILRICTRNQYNIVQFQINISDIDQKKAKAIHLSKRLIEDPKISTSLKHITTKKTTEENKLINTETKFLEMATCKDLLANKDEEEGNDVCDEKIVIQFTNK